MQSLKNMYAKKKRQRSDLCKTFSIGELEWEIRINARYAEGFTVCLLSFPRKFSQFIFLGKVECNELKLSSDRQIHIFTYPEPAWKCKFSLNDIIKKESYRKELTFTMTVQVLKVVLERDDEISYQIPITFQKPFKKQQFLWNLSYPSILNITNGGTETSFFNKIWRLQIMRKNLILHG